MGGSNALGGSYNESNSSTFVIPFSENELELQGINLDVARTQLANIFKQQSFQEDLFRLFASQSGQLGGGLAQSGQTADAAGARLLDIVRGGGPSQQQIALLDQIESNSIQGIRNSTQENLEMLRQELAPQLGFRSSDSPIIDRGGRIARDALQQEGNVRSQRAAAELSLPQQESAFLSELQNRDFLTRLNLGQTAGQTGLGLIGTQNAVTASEFRPNTGTESSSFGLGLQGSWK